MGRLATAAGIGKRGIPATEVALNRMRDDGTAAAGGIEARGVRR